MAKKSKATKAVIASLLATSAIVPAIAASAEAGGETTRAGEATTTSAAAKTIDFKVDAPEALQRFIPTSGKLVERNGQQYINLELSDAVLAMVNSVTVDGQPAMNEFNGAKFINIPVTADYAPVEVTLNMTITFVGNDPVDYKLTLTPDAQSIKEEAAVEKPAEEAKEEKIFEIGKTFESVADGTYAIKWDAYKENVGNYTAISNHFSPDATLVVEDGKYAVQLTVADSSKEMVAGFKIAGQEATEKDGVYTVEIPSISDLHEAGVHVVVAAANMDKWYDFNFAIETADLELPAVEETVETPEPAAETVPVYVYKDGTQELSIMHGRYLNDTVTVTATEGGYDVDVTFPEGQWVNEFTVEGATVALKSEETVGENVVEIYTVTVEDLSKLYTATLDLSVNQGPVVYDSVHKVQMKFGEELVTEAPSAVPFTDIANHADYDAIVNLYNQGIFKAADKFNPASNLTRAQFALMLNRALQLDAPVANFSDLGNYDEETKEAVSALFGHRIIKGMTDTTFGPGHDITRKQAALMIYRVLEQNGYEATGAAANFTDLPADAEAATAIAELNNLGIISGYEGKFNPENKLTRAQMAKVLNNALTALEGLTK